MSQRACCLRSNFCFWPSICCTRAARVVFDLLLFVANCRSRFTLVIVLIVLLVLFEVLEIWVALVEFLA